MFQSGQGRQFADEKHICETCIKEKDCNVKPEPTNWRMVLKYCQRYEKVDK